MERRSISPFLVLVLAVVPVAGCGDADDDGASDPATSTMPPGPVSLEVVAGSMELPDARRASIEVVEGSVRVEGDVADPDAVPAVLTDPTAVNRLVRGPAGDVVCTEQYGGPDVAHVTGTIAGEAVDTRFDRSDGCGIADWDLLTGLLPSPIWSSGPDAMVGDATHPVRRTVGERFTIRLSANMSTGYSWEIDVPDLLTVVDDRYDEADDRSVVGAGGVQVFVIEAVDDGRGVIELGYRRPFDDSPAEDTRTFHVEVDAA